MAISMFRATALVGSLAALAARRCTIVLAAGLALSTAGIAWAADAATRSVSMQDDDIRGRAAAIDAFLDDQGRFALPEHYTGPIDAAGYGMALDADGTPRFVTAKTGQSAVNADDRWADGFQLVNGCDGIVFATVADAAGNIYVGGDFKSCGGIRANGIARFDPATGAWFALGTGGGNGVDVDGHVAAIAISGNDVYVAGFFREVNAGAPIPAGNVARWNGTAWSAIGNGISANVLDEILYAIAVVGGDVYVGGFIEYIGPGATVKANHVVRWTGSSWVPIGTNGGAGVSNTVYALAAVGDELLVGGSFTHANFTGQFPPAQSATIEATYVARWDGQSWSSLGVGGPGAPVRALAVAGNDVYAAANLDVQHPQFNRNLVARWNGNSWTTLGPGTVQEFNSTVRAVTAVGGVVYAAGSFTSVQSGGGTVVNRVARWNGSAWVPLGSGQGAGVDQMDIPWNGIYALAGVGNDLYVGGAFVRANAGEPVSANRIARWNGGQWLALGANGGNGANQGISDMVMFQNQLYVGGSFTHLGGQAFNHIARWDGSNWSPVGTGGGAGANGLVAAMTVYDGALIVAGDFTEVNVGAAMPANRIARWDGSAWSTVGSNGGNGFNQGVAEVVAAGDDLYAGGGFTEANVGANVAANGIARWNGFQWSALGSGPGNGTNNGVVAIVVAGSDVYVGGSFTEVNVGAPVAANRVARWDGSTWSALGTGGGNGVDRPVFAMAMLGGDLIVGGDFTSANLPNAVPVMRIARWNGSSWSALEGVGGPAENNTVLDLLVVGEDLYVGGRLFNGGATTSPGIARWNARGWSRLGSGANEAVTTMVSTDSGHLYVGGHFQLAGDKPASRISRYLARGNLQVALAGSGTGQVNSNFGGIACPGTCNVLLGWDQRVTLTATAAPGSMFVGWSGGACTGIGPCTLDFTDNTQVTANFVAVLFADSFE